MVPLAVYTRVARWTTSVQTQLAIPHVPSAAPIPDAVDDAERRSNASTPDRSLENAEGWESAQHHAVQPIVETDESITRVAVNGATRVEPLSMEMASESDVNSVREDDEEDWESFPLTPPRVRDPW